MQTSSCPLPTPAATHLHTHEEKHLGPVSWSWLSSLAAACGAHTCSLYPVPTSCSQLGPGLRDLEGSGAGPPTEIFLGSWQVVVSAAYSPGFVNEKEAPAAS